MNPELLALIETLDAIKESPPTKPEEGLRLKAIYESQLHKVLERLKSQSKPSSLPPRA